MKRKNSKKEIGIIWVRFIKKRRIVERWILKIGRDNKISWVGLKGLVLLYFIYSNFIYIAILVY
jgi:hypothetical protein